MRFFTFSSYINALSIQEGLNKIGANLFSKEKKGPGFIDFSLEKIRPGDTLFFTEEKSLLAFQERKDLKFFPKNQYDWDDKYLFFQKMLLIGEDPVPSWDLNNPNIKFKKGTIYLKAKRSWLKDIKLPRGFLYTIQNNPDVTHFLENKGFDSTLFFFQKYIKNGTEKTFSVCGYFDSKDKSRNLFITLRKKLGNTKKISTGSVLETVQDPRNLYCRTEKILNSFQYEGPFELEFIYDEQSDKYYVLELNPRFWMQHGIFVKYYKNYLIKSYLKLDSNKDRESIKKRGFQKIYWINSELQNFFYPIFLYTFFKILLKKIFFRDLKIMCTPKLRYNLSLMFYRIQIIFRKIKG